jgi:3-dehydroquinate dehydratase
MNICISLANLNFILIKKIIIDKKNIYELRLDKLDLNENQIIKLININKNIILTDRTKKLSSLIKYLNYGLKYIDTDYRKIDFNTLNIKNNLIVSYHNYKTVPKNINNLINDILKYPASFYKISCYTSSIKQNIKLLSLYNKHNNLIIQSMGIRSTLFRLVSPLVYTYYKTSTAKGQLEFFKLKKTINYIKQYINL